MLDRRTISGFLLAVVWIFGIYLVHLANLSFIGSAGILPLIMTFLGTALLFLKQRNHKLLTGLTTGLVWSIGLMFGSILASNGSGSAALPWFFAMLVTVLAFIYPGESRRTGEKAIRTVEVPKRKRQPQAQTEDEKMRLLWELMDEDERIAFKETLKERMLARYDRFDDGEIPYDLYDMLNDEQAYQQTR